MCSEPDGRPPASPRRGLHDRGRRLLLTASDGADVAAYLATTTAADAPAVVVLPDFRGLHGYYEHLADELAEAGAHALAIDHYSRSAGTGWRGPGFDPMPYRERATDAPARLDVDAALDHLEGLGPARRYVLGFCFGGRRALLQGDRGEIDGVVAFYARVSLQGDGGSPVGLARDGRLRAPVLGIFGGADPHIPVEDVRAFEDACSRAGTACEIAVYDGAPHSFFDHDWAPYQPAAEDVWSRLLPFLGIQS